MYPPPCQPATCNSPQASPATHVTTSPLLYHSDRLQLVDPLVAFWIVDVQAGEHFTMCMTEENGETSVEWCVGVAQGKASPCRS